MSPEFHSKLKLLSEELKQCAAGGTKEQTLDVIDRFIEHLGLNIGWLDPHAYFVLLESLEKTREEYLPKD